MQTPEVPAEQICERPQSLLLVQLDALQPEERQSSLPQWESFVHLQRPDTQSPRSQSLSFEQKSATHDPATAPEHVDPDSEQLLLLVHVCELHVPTTGGKQVAPNPQSVSSLQAPLDPETSASAET